MKFLHWVTNRETYQLFQHGNRRVTLLAAWFNKRHAPEIGDRVMFHNFLDAFHVVEVTEVKSLDALKDFECIAMDDCRTQYALQFLEHPDTEPASRANVLGITLWNDDIFNPYRTYALSSPERISMGRVFAGIYEQIVDHSTMTDQEYREFTWNFWMKTVPHWVAYPETLAVITFEQEVVGFATMSRHGGYSIISNVYLNFPDRPVASEDQRLRDGQYATEDLILSLLGCPSSDQPLSAFQPPILYDKSYDQYFAGIKAWFKWSHTWSGDSRYHYNF